jgi:hypothetical protein
MNRGNINLHLVSDTPGATLAEARRVASGLYAGVAIMEHVHAPVLSFGELDTALRKIERHRGIVLYDLRDKAIIRNLREACASLGCPSLPGPERGRAADDGAQAPSLNTAMRLHFTAARRSRFSATAGLFAAFLALQAAWISLPEWLRPTVAFPFANAAKIGLATSESGAGAIAVFIGFPRGELWASYAVALAAGSLDLANGDKTAVAAPSLLHAREAARRAAELAPHDAKVWLLLAALDTRTDPEGHDVPGALKMSYYTGPNEASLRVLRIGIATKGHALSDAELQSLVAAELRTVVAREPGAKPSILAAYRDASADGKRFLELKLSELDPKWLATVRSVP